MSSLTRAGLLACIGVATAVSVDAQVPTSSSPSTSPLATIPVVVAEAMQLGVGSMAARPQYFDGTLPTRWPATLTPAKATIIGGGIIRVPGIFNLQGAVFSFESFAVGDAAIRSMLRQAGFTRHEVNGAATEGGFASTPRDANRTATFCSDSMMVMFGSMERTQTANIFSMTLMDGAAGRQNCSPQSPSAAARAGIPIAVPTLDPPKGTTFTPTGSSWSGEGGNTNGAIRTTLQTDSIVYHYRDQLVAGGWRAEGKAGIGDGVAVQRFTFQEKGEPWSATLLVMAAGDLRDIQLRFARAR